MKSLEGLAGKGRSDPMWDHKSYLIAMQCIAVQCSARYCCPCTRSHINWSQIPSLQNSLTSVTGQTFNPFSSWLSGWSSTYLKSTLEKVEGSIFCDQKMGRQKSECSEEYSIKKYCLTACLHGCVCLSTGLPIYLSMSLCVCV